MGLHRKSGAIDWAEAERQGDIHGRAGAMRVTVCPRCCGVVPGQPHGEHPGPFAKDLCSPCERVTEERRRQGQLPLLDTTAPPVKRGLDPRNPDDEGWDERYYGAHSDGGD